MFSPECFLLRSEINLALSRNVNFPTRAFIVRVSMFPREQQKFPFVVNKIILSITRFFLLHHLHCYPSPTALKVVYRRDVCESFSEFFIFMIMFYFPLGFRKKGPSPSADLHFAPDKKRAIKLRSTTHPLDNLIVGHEKLSGFQGVQCKSNEQKCSVCLQWDWDGAARWQACNMKYKTQN